MDLWHKTIQKDHYHWVPKGEDPFDTKWSQKRRIPNFGNWFSEGKDSRILRFLRNFVSRIPTGRVTLESDCNLETLKKSEMEKTKRMNLMGGIIEMEHP